MRNHNDGIALRLYYIVIACEPMDAYLDAHPELNHVPSIAYNCHLAMKANLARPVFSWTRTCENSLALFHQRHYPHMMYTT